MGRRVSGCRLRCASIVWLLVAAAVACGEPGLPSDDAVRSAVLITLDTTRADALGSYGGPPGLTPVLDRLAGQSVLYERARSVAPITLPSHASMLTGLYPPRHGLRDNNLRPLPAGAATLAELASAQGFDTAAFVAAVVLDRSFGLDQGFQTYQAPPRRLQPAGPGPGSHETRFGDLRAGEVATAAAAWLRAKERIRPFFLWVHFFDPHRPYEPLPDMLERAGGEHYLGEVAAVDAGVGRILRALGRARLLRHTLVVVVGDHGEGLGEHGEETHGTLLYDSTLRVPLLVRHPDGYRAGERSDELVSVVDVFPTLLEALGLETPEAGDGLSLYRDRAPPDRGVYFETYYGALRYGWAPLVGWLDGSGKYVHGPTPRFFAIDADPGETRALEAAPDPHYLGHIQRLLSAPGLAEEGSIDPALRRQLEQLGYASGGDWTDLELPDPLAPGPLLDPHDRSEEIRRIDRAANLLAEEELGEGIRELRAVLAENPRNFTVIEVLGSALASDGRCAAAIRLLEDLLDRGFGRMMSYTNLGGCLLKVGRTEEALAPLLRAHELEPTEPMPLRGLARALRALERPEEAAEYERRLAALRDGASGRPEVDSATGP